MINIYKKTAVAAVLLTGLLCACGQNSLQDMPVASNQDNIQNLATNSSESNQQTCTDKLKNPITALICAAGISGGEVIEEIPADDGDICLVYQFSDGRIINYRMEETDGFWSVAGTIDEKFAERYRKAAEYVRNVTAQRLRGIVEDADSVNPYENIYEMADKFILLGMIEESDTALYGLYGGNAMVLRIGDNVYPVWRMWSDRNVKFAEGDYDNDGRKEYFYSTCEGYGTGMYIEGVHIFEINDNMLEVCDFRNIKEQLGRISYRYDEEKGAVYWIVDGREIDRPQYLIKGSSGNRLTDLNLKLQRSVIERDKELYFEILAAAVYNSDGVIDYEDQLCIMARIEYLPDGQFKLADISVPGSDSKTFKRKLPTETMKAYDRQDFQKVISTQKFKELKLDNISGDIIYYNNGDFEIILFKESENSPFYVMINDQKLIFNHDTEYNISRIQTVSLVLYDLNGDGIRDVMISDDMIYHSICDNAYLSSENGKYTEIGGISWQWTNYKEKGLPDCQITLLDNYEALVEMNSFNIREKVTMHEFQNLAFRLGLYDEKGKLTPYGEKWNNRDNIYRAPYPRELEYLIDEHGQAVFRITAPITIGYADYQFDGGFIFEWGINEGEYELSSVEFFRGC